MTTAQNVLAVMGAGTVVFGSIVILGSVTCWLGVRGRLGRRFRQWVDGE